MKGEQIDWIRSDLRQRGLLYPPLREEILDHICDAIEGQMAKGVSFIDAYREVLASFGPQGLDQLNQQTLTTIGPFVMLKSYLQIAFRNLARHRLPSLINLLGLVVGMTTCLLILLYVQEERSFDSYHQKADRIFRLTTRLTFDGREDHSALLQNGIATQIGRDYPEVEGVIRLRFNKGFELSRENTTVNVPAASQPPSGGASQAQVRRLFNSDQVLYLYDAAYLEVFTHPMLQGDPKTALTRPGSMVLTAGLAKQCFGSAWQAGKGVVGRVLQFNGEPYSITGVIREVPSNTDLPFQALLRQDSKELEAMSWCMTYVLFKDAASGVAFGAKLGKIAAKLNQELSKRGASIAFLSENLRKVHLGKTKTFDTPKANPLYLSLFSLVAGLLLLIASINFINLSIAQSAQRSAEVGIRKAMGAARFQLLVQFLSESLLLTLLAAGVSLLAVVILLPFYNQLTGKTFSVPALLSWPMSGYWLLLVAGVGLLAGSYPALYLSSFQPVSALKGNLRLGGKSLKSLLGKGLIVFQFTLSVALIVATVAVYSQLRYLQSKPVGFRKEQILVVEIPRDAATRQRMPQLKEALLRYPAFGAVALSGSLSLPGQETNLAPFNFHLAGSMTTMPQRFIDVDEDYLKLLQVPLAAGRGFSAQGATRGEVLVNETLARKVGYKTPQAALGQLVSQGQDDPASRARIVGVVKDFHFLSPHFPIEPLVLLPSASTLPEEVLIRLSAGKLEAQLEWVAREWKRLVPDHPFEFTFLDETFNQQYQQEQRLVPLFTYFSLVTILVACLGLFGLVSFAARLRSKEVGIRKVLGAREGSLILLLTWEYLLLVVGGILLASPLAWYLVNGWLEGFAYRITISGWMFVLAGGVAILIATLTTGYHARKAARTDPVRALRYE